MVKESRREIKFDDYIKERQQLDYDPETQTCFDFMYLTGARVSEMLKVKPNDIDFDKKTVDLQTEKNPHEKNRTAYFCPKGTRALILVQSIKTFSDTKESNKPIWTFSNIKTKRQKVWKKSWQYFGTNDHSFRHTHAVILARDYHLQQRELMNQMGWWQFNTCMAYLIYDFNANIEKKIRWAKEGIDNQNPPEPYD